MKSTIIMYCNHINYIGGIETYIYNWCQHLADKYDVTVLYRSGDIQQVTRLYDYANVDLMDDAVQYSCDVLLSNSAWAPIPPNVHAKKSYKIIHADYRDMELYGWKFVNDADAYLAVSQIAADSVKELFGIDATIISPLMGYKQEPKHILRLVSFTRLTPEKGGERVKQFAEELRKNNIPFEWRFYSDKSLAIQGFPEIVMSPPTLDVATGLSNADYLVQLSRTESFCYSVHEALQYGTPVICTDIPAFRGVIVNGYNGYLIPCDMSAIDAKTIYGCIPSNFEYVVSNEDSLDKWVHILGEPQRNSHTEHRVENNVRVKALMSYYDTSLNRYINQGEEFEVEHLRSLDLCTANRNRPAVATRVYER